MLNFEIMTGKYKKDYIAALGETIRKCYLQRKNCV